MEKVQVNARRHLRYRHPDQQVYQILFEEKQGTAEIVNALLVNESHAGFACVVVGPAPASEARFQHLENEKISVPLILRHQRELAGGIQLLGFERADTVIRSDGA